MRRYYFIFIIVLTGLLCGCGQSGALYLANATTAKQHPHDKFLLYRPATQVKEQKNGSL